MSEEPPVMVSLKALFGGVVGGLLSASGVVAQPPAGPMPVEPREQYNEALSTLYRAVMHPETPEEEAKKAALKFLEDARAVPGGVASLKEAQKTIMAIERALENKDQEFTEADLARLGPGSVSGYAATVEGGGSVIRFKPDAAAGGAGLPELVFVRVAMIGGGFVYLSTTEMSVGAFGAIIDKKAAPGDMARIGFPGFEMMGDPRVGPRSWEWSGLPGGAGKRGVVPARAWLSRLGGAAVREYPAGLEPAPPSADSPMQHVSPASALLVSRLVGCRLPSGTEWGAARGQFAAAVGMEKFNLRDASWKKEYDWVRGQIREGKRAQYPDAGAFFVGGRPDAAKRGIANAWDDGTIWFRAVADGGGADGALVKHLVGNVAEYVVDGSGPEVPAAGAGPVKVFLENPGVKLGVVGGSALSEPGMDVDKVQQVPVGEAGDGYSDVGFRLAFGMGSGAPQAGIRRTLAERLWTILDPLPVLQRR